MSLPTCSKEHYIQGLTLGLYFLPLPRLPLRQPLPLTSYLLNMCMYLILFHSYQVIPLNTLDLISCLFTSRTSSLPFTSLSIVVYFVFCLLLMTLKCDYVKSL